MGGFWKTALHGGSSPWVLAENRRAPHLLLVCLAEASVRLWILAYAPGEMVNLGQ